MNTLEAVPAWLKFHKGGTFRVRLPGLHEIPNLQKLLSIIKDQHTQNHSSTSVCFYYFTLSPFVWSVHGIVACHSVQISYVLSTILLATM